MKKSFFIIFLFINFSSASWRLYSQLSLSPLIGFQQSRIPHKPDIPNFSELENLYKPSYNLFFGAELIKKLNNNFELSLPIQFSNRIHNLGNYPGLIYAERLRVLNYQLQINYKILPYLSYYISGGMNSILTYHRRINGQWTNVKKITIDNSNLFILSTGIIAFYKTAFVRLHYSHSLSSLYEISIHNNKGIEIGSAKSYMLDWGLAIGIRLNLKK